MIRQLFFPNDNKAGHQPALDGLRGMAVLLVALAHLSNNGIHFAPFLHFGGMGKTGVYLFFLLSSYLLDRQIVLAIRQDQAHQRFWGNYFLRRVLRIFPLYLFVLIAYHLIFRTGSEYCLCIRTPKALLAHILLLRGDGVFWSIPVEFKYYFLSPFLILFYGYVLRWHRLAIFLFTLGCAVGINYYTYVTGYFSTPRIATFAYLPVFLWGSWLATAEVLNQGSQNRFLISSRAWHILGLVALFLVFTLSGRFYFQQLYGKAAMPMYFLFRQWITVQGFLFMMVLIGCLYGGGRLQRIFSFRPLRFIGVISFSFYLIHFPVIKWLQDQHFGTYDQQWKVLLFFAITTLICSITYLLIERPFSRTRWFNNQKLFTDSHPTTPPK